MRNRTTPSEAIVPQAVIDEFLAIVGRENALVTDDERTEYADPYWFPGDRTYDSSLVIFPTSSEQVQEIVRVAGRHDVPLWASGQGRNFGYGGASARVRGSVLLSFRKMNRVLEIDDDLAYAVVEPGVTWYDLYNALHERGDELMVAIPDIGWGSVIGNSLDNGVTFLPTGTDFQALTGLEVVLADGSIVRTGFGAQEGNPSWHLYKRGLGPAIDSLFTQSNLGIVTRAGVGLNRRPRAYAPIFLSIPRYRQIGAAVDAVRQLRQEGILRGVPGFQDLLTEGETHFREHAGKIPHPGLPTIPEEQLDAVADETGLGRWGVRAGLWGEPAVLDLHEERIREVWAAVEGGQVRRLATYTPENWHEIADAGVIDRLFGGVPSQDIQRSIPDFVGHLDFSPVVPMRGEEVTKVMNHIKRRVEERSGQNFTGAIFPINDRAAIVVTHLLFNRTDPARVKVIYDLAHELIDELGAMGYAEYRMHISLQDEAQAQLDFGDHAYRQFLETIKDAVDPKGILSPGRYGIWPAGYRGSTS